VTGRACRWPTCASSGLVSAFQAEELAAAEKASRASRRGPGGPPAGTGAEWVPLAMLHEVLEAAFGT
jgi:hypothetical protein